MHQLEDTIAKVSNKIIIYTWYHVYKLLNKKFKKM